MFPPVFLAIALSVFLSTGEAAARPAHMAGGTLAASGLRLRLVPADPTEIDLDKLSFADVSTLIEGVQQGKDPIYVGAQIVIALQGLVSRELSPLEAGVVTVGSFHGGFKHNIIPDKVELQLTVRADTDSSAGKARQPMRTVVYLAAGTAPLPDVFAELDYERHVSTPPTVNDEALAQRIHAAFVRELGEDLLFEDKREGMGAEDFAYFVRTEHAVPGAYFAVGGTAQADLDAEKAGGPAVPSHHSPLFKVEPEPAVTSGVRAMTVAVLELLGKP